MEPFWKHLVEQLTEQGVSGNPYLDRLRDRLSSMQVQVINKGAIEQEIIDEMAFSLCNAEDKINAALLEASVYAEAVSEREIEKYNDAVQRARKAKWEYKVHREAIGLIDHRVLEELFPIPKLK